MDNEKIQEIISNPDNIIKVIDVLNDSFDMLYLKYTLESLKKTNPVMNIDYTKLDLHSALSYYQNGHCASYAKILSQIFNQAIKYNSSEHVIVRIANHFYDVRGLIDNIVTSEFHITTEDDEKQILETQFGLPDALEKPIEKDLIEIGKEELNKIYINSTTKSK